MAETPNTSQPKFWDVWWPRLRREPMAICLIISLMFNRDQKAERIETARQTDAKLLRWEMKCDAKDAALRLAERERDSANAKVIRAQEVTISILRGRGGSPP